MKFCQKKRKRKENFLHDSHFYFVFLLFLLKTTPSTHAWSLSLRFPHPPLGRNFFPSSFSHPGASTKDEGLRHHTWPIGMHFPEWVLRLLRWDLWRASCLLGDGWTFASFWCSSKKMSPFICFPLSSFSASPWGGSCFWSLIPHHAGEWGAQGPGWGCRAASRCSHQDTHWHVWGSSLWWAQEQVTGLFDLRLCWWHGPRFPVYWLGLPGGTGETGCQVSPSAPFAFVIF